MATILVVDDSQFVRLRMKRMLEQEGYRVIEASDGFEAIFAYERERPDMVLLDITMPGKTGLEVLVDIRAMDETAVVIMLTAIEQEETMLSAMASGALDYLAKQQEPADLLAIVKGYLVP